MRRPRSLAYVTWVISYYACTLISAVVGVFQEPDIELERANRDANFFEVCTLKSVENICARNITMAGADGSIVRAPGVTVWIQAHCGNEEDEQKRSVCVLSYIGDDFGKDQADEFFSCVCEECPRACNRQGNLRNRQNMIAMESQ